MPHNPDAPEPNEASVSDVREVDVRLIAEIGAEPSRVFEALERPQVLAALASRPGRALRDEVSGRVRVQAEGQTWGTEIVPLASEPPNMLQVELIPVPDTQRAAGNEGASPHRASMLAQADLEASSRGGTTVTLEVRLLFMMEPMESGVFESFFNLVFRKASVWFLRRRCRALMISLAGELKAPITFQK